MSKLQTIAISPLHPMVEEAKMINVLFDAGLHRYHIHKADATEHGVAEILEGIEPKYLGNITLHSHFHLVLAYGVGGIHYALEHRVGLGKDYISKAELYQGFGVKVSTLDGSGDCAPADYILTQSDTVDQPIGDNIAFLLSHDVESIGSGKIAILLDEALKRSSLDMIIDQLGKNQITKTEQI